MMSWSVLLSRFVGFLICLHYILILGEEVNYVVREKYEIAKVKNLAKWSRWLKQDYEEIYDRVQNLTSQLDAFLFLPMETVAMYNMRMNELLSGFYKEGQPVAEDIIQSMQDIYGLVKDIKAQEYEKTLTEFVDNFTKWTTVFPYGYRFFSDFAEVEAVKKLNDIDDELSKYMKNVTDVINGEAFAVTHILSTFPAIKLQNSTHTNFLVKSNELVKNYTYNVFRNYSDEALNSLRDFFKNYSESHIRGRVERFRYATDPDVPYALCGLRINGIGLLIDEPQPSDRTNFYLNTLQSSIKLKFIEPTFFDHWVDIYAPEFPKKTEDCEFHNKTEEIMSKLDSPLIPLLNTAVVGSFRALDGILDNIRNNTNTSHLGLSLYDISEDIESEVITQMFQIKRNLAHVAKITEITTEISDGLEKKEPSDMGASTGNIAGELSASAEKERVIKQYTKNGKGFQVISKTQEDLKNLVDNRQGLVRTSIQKMRDSIKERNNKPRSERLGKIKALTSKFQFKSSDDDKLSKIQLKDFQKKLESMLVKHKRRAEMITSPFQKKRAK